jgi:hypothetical protein
MTPETMAAIRILGIDPALLDALAGEGRMSAELGKGHFDIPLVGFEDETQPHHRWNPDPFERSCTTDPPGIWTPFGVAADALVVVGAATGLALGNLLFGVSPVDGTVRRKPRLPDSLADLAPVVLPEDDLGVSSEWLAEPHLGGVLVALLKEQGFRRIFLAINRRPFDREPVVPAVDRLSLTVVDEARINDIPAVLVPLEGFATLRDIWTSYEGYGRAYSLGGVLNYAELLSRQWLINLETEDPT